MLAIGSLIVIRNSLPLCADVFRKGCQARMLCVKAMWTSCRALVCRTYVDARLLSSSLSRTIQLHLQVIYAYCNLPLAILQLNRGHIRHTSASSLYALLRLCHCSRALCSHPNIQRWKRGGCSKARKSCSQPLPHIQERANCKG